MMGESLCPGQVMLNMVVGSEFKAAVVRIWACSLGLFFFLVCGELSLLAI